MHQRSACAICDRFGTSPYLWRVRPVRPTSAGGLGTSGVGWMDSEGKMLDGVYPVLDLKELKRKAGTGPNGAPQLCITVCMCLQKRHRTGSPSRTSDEVPGSSVFIVRPTTPLSLSFSAGAMGLPRVAYPVRGLDVSPGRIAVVTEPLSRDAVHNSAAFVPACSSRSPAIRWRGTEEKWE